MPSFGPRASRVRALFLLLAGISAPSGLLHAQTATVSGTVRDPGQLAVPGASVTLQGPPPLTPLSAQTDGQGNYIFATVPAGTYTLVVNKPGFSPAKVENVTVATGMDTKENVGLALGGTNASVTVSGAGEGSSANGYHVEHLEAGVMGAQPVRNQPFTISVLPSSEIANTQVRSLKEALMLLPLVSFQEQQGSEILRPQTRGIEGSIVQNTRMDGRAIAITGANPIEQYQQLEVVNGLGASMYGPANPSGMFNFVLKRPTNQRTEDLWLDYDSKTIGTAYADLGGRFGPHQIFGYRSNLLFADGEAWVNHSFLRRRLAESAFDVRPTNRTVIDGHYSAYDIVQRGYPGWFTYGPDKAVTGVTPPPTFLLPAAPDPTQVGYGQAYGGVNLTTQSGGAMLHHDFSDNWHAMAGGLFQRLDRFIDTPVNNITDNIGDYSTSLASGFAPRFGTSSDLGYITGTLHRWGIDQDLVAGSEGFLFNQYAGQAIPAANLLLGTANVAAPRIYAEPRVGLPEKLGLYRASIVHQQGFNLGDLIGFHDKFLVRLAASQDWIGVDNNGATGARTGGSNKNGISPSVSLLYKPQADMTLYATYASSLQQGDIAPGNAVNANQALAPYRSKEWELGYKGQLRTIAIGTALFRIERPFANTNAANVFEITGTQVNYGAEISAQGSLFHRLLLDGGFTALNARLNDTGISATDGKRFVGTPPYQSNFLSEYRLPFIDGLIVTGEWRYQSYRPQDDENLHTTGAFSTFDFGLRYAHLVLGRTATWRVNANNVTNTEYYSTIGPGDITGTNASSNTAHLGAPRTVAASVQITF